MIIISDFREVTLYSLKVQIRKEYARTLIYFLSNFQIVGLWPASHPVPEVEAALNLPELSHFRVDFEQSLRRAIIVTIAGLRSKIE